VGGEGEGEGEGEAEAEAEGEGEGEAEAEAEGEGEGEGGRRKSVLGIIRVVGILSRMNVGSLRHRDGERRSPPPPPPPPPPWLPATVLLLLFFVCACGGIDTQADRASCRYCAAKGTTAMKMADSPMLGHRHLDRDLDQHHSERKAAFACRLRGGQGGEEGEGAEKGEEGEGAEKGQGGGGGAIEEREGADEAEVEHDHGEEDGDICEDDVVMLSRVKAFMAANPGGFGTGKKMHVLMARLVSKLQARSKEVKASNRRRAPLPSATDFLRGVERVSEEFGPLPKLPEDRSAALGGGRAAATTATTLGGGLVLSSSTRSGAIASLRSGLGSASGLSELEQKRMAAHEAARNALLGDAFQVGPIRLNATSPNALDLNLIPRPFQLVTPRLEVIFGVNLT
jgi:hypothetical protein